MKKYILMTVLSTLSFVCHAQQYEVGTTTAIWKNSSAFFPNLGYFGFG